jgi:hypothetical protein
MWELDKTAVPEGDEHTDAMLEIEAGHTDTTSEADSQRRVVPK